MFLKVRVKVSTPVTTLAHCDDTELCTAMRMTSA